MSSPTAPAHTPPAVCAVCYLPYLPHDRATVPACAHAFCTHCIINWSSLRATCPLCKAPFSSLLVQRTLSGAPAEEHPEPLPLLLRARWVEVAPMTSLAEDAAAEAAMPVEYAPRPLRSAYTASEMYEDELEASCCEAVEWEEREALRGGRVLGNRRHGNGGYVSSGRMVARVVPAGGGGKRRGRRKNKASASETQQPGSSSAPPPSE